MGLQMKITQGLDLEELIFFKIFIYLFESERVGEE